MKIYSKEMEDFINKGLSLVIDQLLENGGNDDDVDSMKHLFNQCFRDGFTLHDAVRMARYTEHVNPEWTEEYACRKIGQIMDKYMDKYKKTREKV